MKELVRCRPCGYVMEADKLGDVCPACGMSRKVFEPYREKVALNRLRLLNLDLHPIAIHLSQTLVITIPVFIIISYMFVGFHPELIINILQAAVFLFPFTLVLAMITGMIDGFTRFKTLNTPLLKIKILFSIIILILSVAMMVVGPKEGYGLWTFVLSVASLVAGIQLGLWGKKLINVILPGSFPKRKRKDKKQPQTE
ncbi:MAG: hypothetical protein WCR58_01620 [Bacteroidales bacterium]|jgi:O-antigen/teichoic acid export membrane protein/rubredoxin|nr:hypothetical protein [Bacteroidales bacterium]MCK9449415.1 hypothetical protein [Bacteroidales bacterium]MDD3700377.1 hypothetical protein [Bacteroidales bacterium]MDY0368737.1 hypothetical protein [Bacteroidales bacterium]